MSVWDDISDTTEEAENLKVRAKFIRAIRTEIESRGGINQALRPT